MRESDGGSVATLVGEPKFLFCLYTVKRMRGRGGCLVMKRGEWGNGVTAARLLAAGDGTLRAVCFHYSQQQRGRTSIGYLVGGAKTTRSSSKHRKLTPLSNPKALDLSAVIRVYLF